MAGVAEAAVVDRTTTLQTLLDTPAGRRMLTCIQCGTCAGTCPYGDYMEFSPRLVINMLRRGFIDEVIKSDSLLRCVACYACTAKCPRNIRLTDVLLPLVKEQVLMNNTQMPAEFQKSLENMHRYGNPMGESPRKRAAWTATAGVKVPLIAEVKCEVDVLWFVECYTSFYARGQENSRATAKLFAALGVDFAILGNDEKCAGECGQMTWESGLFESLAEYNMKLFGKYKFRRIVTGDAHAFNAFRFRYPMYGLTQPVEHTTQFFARHLEQLKPKLKKPLNLVVTYHDPCCLGRAVGAYEEPRALLQAIPGVKLVEMVHNRVNSVCCGGGGGGMWLDTYYKQKGMDRLSERRVKEAIAVGADVLAVACPYEVSRFEDALKVVPHDKPMVVRDVVELLAESIG
ncbi:MAG: (Fe-S)-binding protein [Verrucomicrobiota bacterium]|nr:(Fe-S)-binding protein [Verrucomicrobiota bacterium]